MASKPRSILTLPGFLLCWSVSLGILHAYARPRGLLIKARCAILVPSCAKGEPGKSEPPPQVRCSPSDVPKTQGVKTPVPFLVAVNWRQEYVIKRWIRTSFFFSPFGMKCDGWCETEYAAGVRIDRWNGRSRYMDVANFSRTWGSTGSSRLRNFGKGNDLGSCEKVRSINIALLLH